MIRRAGEWVRRRASLVIVLVVVGVLGGGGLVAEALQEQQVRAQAHQARAQAQRVQARLDRLEAQLAAERKAQERQGQAVEQKLCTTFVGLAELPPPAGSPADNPSRAYLQNQHARLAQVAPDIGCPR